MAEVYDVVYNIQVISEQATLGINRFTQATSGLTKASANLEKFATTFNKINAMNQKGFVLKIDSNQALKKLQTVENKIREIRNLAKGITIGTTGGNTTTRSGSRASAPRQVPVPAPTTTRQQRPTGQTTRPVQTPRAVGPRPLVGSRAYQPLIPRNLEYQVLGPTRLGNVAMLDMFKGMGLMYGISALGSGIRDIITTSTEYQNVMQTAKNILKTNYKGNNFNASFADMEQIVRDVGMETKFTAPEVADAVKFLAMAGLDINAIKKSIRPIADIALIGDTDLGQTADVMTNIMTAYGIKPDDMRKTADIMTRTFTMSNTTLMELAESFKMAGSMLHLANVPFETAAAAFGVLGDAGIKATMAGTTMRTIMNNLRNPTKGQKSYWDMLGVRRYDEYGNLREINEIFGDLNKLNGNDERSMTARAKYEELQNKYAPKLEGLTEGSTEYNKLLAEYDKESEAIRKQFGGVDVFRLFRLTAASGAGVLMSHVDKWNQIIEENFLSEGLSKKLADEKKNTIQGLWAQLKSAFQEGGLKVFEENDERFRGFLKKGIAWLKSDDFTKILRESIDLVVSLGKTLVEFTRIIVRLYDKFAPLVKTYLKFQLYAKGFQTILISIKGLGNSFLYLISSLFGFSGRPAAIGMGRYMMPTAAAGVAPAASMYGMGGWYSSVLYNNPFWRHMGPGYSKLLETGNAAEAVKANPNYNPMNHAANVAMLRRYQNSRKRINAMNRFSGLGMIGGSVLGGWIGNNFDEGNGMMWGSIIGGGLGSIAPMLFSAGPWGVVIGAAAIGVTALISHFVKLDREIKKAKKTLDEFNNTEVRLGLRNLDVSDAEELFRTNIMLSTDAIIDQNEKLRIRYNLMQKIANYGAEDKEEPVFHYEKFSDTPFGKAFAEKLDAQITTDKADYKKNKNILERGDDRINGITKPGEISWYQTATEMADRFDNPLYVSGRNDIMKNIVSVSNMEQWRKFKKSVLSGGIEGYTTPSQMNRTQYEYKDILDANYNDALRNWIFAGETNKRLEELMDSFDWYARHIEELTTQSVPSDITNKDNKFAQVLTLEKSIQAFTELHASPVIDDLLDPYKYGYFGTEEWINSMNDLFQKGKLEYEDIDAAGNKVIKSVDLGTPYQFNNLMQSLYGSMVNVYDQLNPKVQEYYKFMFDQNYWKLLNSNPNFDFTTGPQGTPIVTKNQNGGWDYIIKDYQDYFFRNDLKEYLEELERNGGDKSAARDHTLRYREELNKYNDEKLDEYYKQLYSTSDTTLSFSQYGTDQFGNGLSPISLPSTKGLNDALARAEKGVVVNPNVTKNNNYTFTFQIETLRTDMDEDQLAQYIDEKFIPAVIDKLDASYEGVATA